MSFRSSVRENRLGGEQGAVSCCAFGVRPHVHTKAKLSPDGSQSMAGHDGGTRAGPLLFYVEFLDRTSLH